MRAVTPGRADAGADRRRAVQLGLDAARVAQLVEEGFLSPASQQNLGPPAGHILELLRAWPELRAQGYAVSEQRPDYRITLDGLYADVADVDPERADALREMLSELGHQASNVELDGDDLYVWWT